MTMVEWARLVDGMIVQLAPSLRFNLDGKRALDVFKGHGVPDEAYERPQWTSQGRFVVMYPRSDGTVRATFMPPAVDWDDAFTDPAFQRERFYDMDPVGARRAADEVIDFLAIFGAAPPVPTRVDTRPDAFLSHADEDSEFCNRLESALAERGIAVWYDRSRKNGIPAGGRIAGNIDGGLRLCRGGIVLATPTYFTKPFCLEEYNAIMYRYVGRSEPVIAVVKDMTYTEFGDLAPMLSGRSNVHLRDGFDAVVERLVQVFRPLAPSAVSGASVATNVDPTKYTAKSGTEVSAFDQDDRDAPLDALPDDERLAGKIPVLNLAVAVEGDSVRYGIGNSGTLPARGVTLFLPGLLATRISETVMPGSTISVDLSVEERSRAPIRGQAQAVIEFEDPSGNVFREYADTLRLKMPGKKSATYKTGKASRPYLVAQRIIDAREGVFQAGVGEEPPRLVAAGTTQMPPILDAARTPPMHVAFYVDDGFFVVPAERIAHGATVEIVAIADDAGLASALDRLRTARDSTVGVAFGLKALPAQVLSIREEVTAIGRRVAINLAEVSRPSVFEVNMQGRSATDIAAMRARRILLDETLPIPDGFSSESLNATTLEVLVQNRNSLMPVIRSPLPALWRIGSADPPAEFLENAKLVALLYLHLSDTVQRVERLDLALRQGARLDVNFVGYRAKAASNVPPERIGVVGKLRLAPRDSGA